MTKNSRVIHATRGYAMKFGQVQKRIADNCCFVWVKYGETFRDATIQEAASMRKQQDAAPNNNLVYFVEGKDGKPIEKTYFAEIPGLIYQPATRNLESSRKSYPLIRQAHEFAAAQ